MYVLSGASPLLLSLIQGSGTSERTTSGMGCNDMTVADEVVADEGLFLVEHRSIIGLLTASLSGSQASSSSGAATNMGVYAFYLQCSLLLPDCYLISSRGPVPLKQQHRKWHAVM